jgi:hypothetical protein
MSKEKSALTRRIRYGEEELINIDNDVEVLSSLITKVEIINRIVIDVEMENPIPEHLLMRNEDRKTETVDKELNTAFDERKKHLKETVGLDLPQILETNLKTLNQKLDKITALEVLSNIRSGKQLSRKQRELFGEYQNLLESSRMDLEEVQADGERNRIYEKFSGNEELHEIMFLALRAYDSDFFTEFKKEEVKSGNGKLVSLLRVPNETLNEVTDHYVSQYQRLNTQKATLSPLGKISNLLGDISSDLFPSENIVESKILNLRDDVLRERFDDVALKSVLSGFVEYLKKENRNSGLQAEVQTFIENGVFEKQPLTELLDKAAAEFSSEKSRKGVKSENPELSQQLRVLKGFFHERATDLQRVVRGVVLPRVSKRKGATDPLPDVNEDDDSDGISVKSGVSGISKKSSSSYNPSISSSDAGDEDDSEISEIDFDDDSETSEIEINFDDDDSEISEIGERGKGRNSMSKLSELDYEEVEAVLKQLLEDIEEFEGVKINNLKGKINSFLEARKNGKSLESFRGFKDIISSLENLNNDYDFEGYIDVLNEISSEFDQYLGQDDEEIENPAAPKKSSKKTRIDADDNVDAASIKIPSLKFRKGEAQSISWDDAERGGYAKSSQNIVLKNADLRLEGNGFLCSYYKGVEGSNLFDSDFDSIKLNSSRNKEAKGLRFAIIEDYKPRKDWESPMNMGCIINVDETGITKTFVDVDVIKRIEQQYYDNSTVNALLAVNDLVVAKGFKVDSLSEDLIKKKINFDDIGLTLEAMEKYSFNDGVAKERFESAKKKLGDIHANLYSANDLAEYEASFGEDYEKLKQDISDINKLIPEGRRKEISVAVVAEKQKRINSYYSKIGQDLQSLESNPEEKNKRIELLNSVSQKAEVFSSNDAAEEFLQDTKERRAEFARISKLSEEELSEIAAQSYFLKSKRDEYKSLLKAEKPDIIKDSVSVRRERLNENGETVDNIVTVCFDGKSNKDLLYVYVPGTYPTAYMQIRKAKVSGLIDGVKDGKPHQQEVTENDVMISDKNTVFHKDASGNYVPTTPTVREKDWMNNFKINVVSYDEKSIGLSTEKTVSNINFFNGEVSKLHKSRAIQVKAWSVEADDSKSVAIDVIRDQNGKILGTVKINVKFQADGKMEFGSKEIHYKDSKGKDQVVPFTKDNDCECLEVIGLDSDNGFDKGARLAKFNEIERKFKRSNPKIEIATTRSDGLSGPVTVSYNSAVYPSNKTNAVEATNIRTSEKATIIDKASTGIGNVAKYGIIGTAGVAVAGFGVGAGLVGGGLYTGAKITELGLNGTKEVVLGTITGLDQVIEGLAGGFMGGVREKTTQGVIDGAKQGSENAKNRIGKFRQMVAGAFNKDGGGRE